MDHGIVGIRYTEAGPIHYCSPGDLRLGIGDYVIVGTARGERLGWVVLTPGQVISATLEGPMRVVSRLASAEEVDAYREQKRRAQEDISRAQAGAARVDPRVRVASLEYDLAGSFGELTYTARENAGDVSDRVHREVMRMLAPQGGLNLHVEQVGERDRAKALGGLGQCGRALCCSTWMTEFPAISIKMAKDQGLAPNPSKISGVCGRLLCCLSFEVDAYREIVGSLPKVGKRLTTPVGKAKVLSINAITEMVRLRFDETGQIIEISTDAVRRQMGTTLRPDELDAEFEEALREKDRRRTESLIAVLTPVDRPLRETSAADGPHVDEAERAERRARRSAARRADGADAGGGASIRRRPARSSDRPRPADGRPRGERRAAPEGGESRSGIRITRRRAADAPASPRSESPSARPPARRDGDVIPPGASAAGEEKRRRRRGRRGGRRRSGGGDGGGSNEATA